MQGLLGNYG